MGIRVNPAVAVLVAVLTLTIVASATPAGGSAAESDVQDSLTYDLKNAERFRETFGLRSDQEYLKQSVTDRERFVDTSYGVRLTAAEARDMNRRIETAASTQPALDYAIAQPD